MTTPSPAPSAVLTWRAPTASEIDVCLRAQPHALGRDIVGPMRARAAWQTLFRNRLLVARVIERSAVDMTPHVVGFGASVFVMPEFIDAEIRSPRAGLTSRIIASVAEGDRIVLDRRAIARANAGTGLEAVFIASAWWETATPLEFTDMLMASVGSCVDAHAGYRLRGATSEISGDQLRLVGTHTGELEVLGVFPSADRALVRFTRERISTVAGSLSNRLFQYHEPLLGCSDAQQQLLMRAVDGATDRTLAADLHLTLTAVKRRWRGIFDKVEDRAPRLFADMTSGDDGKRGPQRRHLVVTYVRNHPEELRPFDASSRTTDRR